MTKSSTVEVVLRLGDKTEVFKEALASATIKGATLAVKEESLVISIDQPNSNELLKSMYILTTYSTFILRTLKELDGLD